MSNQSNLDIYNRARDPDTPYKQKQTTLIQKAEGHQYDDDLQTEN